MGNTSSSGNEKDGQCDRVLLDSLVEEVSQVAPALLDIVENVRHKQKDQTDANTATVKEMLDQILNEVFGKLKRYFTTDFSTTSAELNEKGTEPSDAIDMMTQTGTDLTKPHLSEVIKLMEKQMKLKDEPFTVENLLAHIEAHEKCQNENSPAVKLLSKENMKHDSSFQQNKFSEEVKTHDGKGRHEIKPVEVDKGIVNDKTDNRSDKDKTAKQMVTRVPGIGTVRNKDSIPTVSDGTKHRSFKRTSGNSTFTSGNTKHAVAGKASNSSSSVGNCGKTTLNILTGDQQDAVKSETYIGNARDEIGNGAETDKTNNDQCIFDATSALSLADGKKKTPEEWVIIPIDAKKEVQTDEQATNDDTEEIKRLKDEVKRLEDVIAASKIENKDIGANFKGTEKNNNHANEVTKIDTDIKSKQKEIRSLKEENERLVLRLSKLAGEKLTKDNPNITDLSDQNRPTKLGEIYSELYDNEWTDAYEGLLNGGYQEPEAIRALNITLKTAYRFCEKNAHDMLEKTEHVAMQLFEECKQSQIGVGQSMAVHRSPHDGSEQFSRSMVEEQFVERHWKPKQRSSSGHLGARRSSNTANEVVKPAKIEGELVKLRKEVSISMVPVVQQAYLRGKWDETCIEPLKPFIKKCLFLCWMMVVQSPPMVFEKNTEQGAKFDSAIYKQYTKSGDVIEYVVWPALLLYEDGSIVCKGVAQPKRKAQK